LVTSSVIFEALASLLAIATALACRRRCTAWIGRAEYILRRVARRKRLTVALVGALALSGSAGVALVRGVQVPSNNDEFSYLLAADTFASGRLTNPPHPHWVHFESIQVLQQPTYASKFPPAQGLALAMGQVLWHPVLGVWLSVALACAALTWMLQAWLPPPWALLGGLLAVVRFALFSYWGQRYWGGAVAALGGALLFGALRRLLPRPRPRDAVLLGLGLALLANSRPYEGLLVSLVAAAVLFRGVLDRSGPPLSDTLRAIVLPVGFVLALTAAAMAYYNFRVTGDPLRVPYQVYEATYAIAPPLLWQPLRPERTFRHEVLEDYHRKVASKYVEQRTLSGLLREKGKRFFRVWRFYLGPLLTLPLVMLPWALRDHWTRIGLLTCGVLGVGLFAGSWLNPHYAAPITAVLYALVLRCMRHLRAWRRGRRSIGLVLVWAILLFWVAAAPQMWVTPWSWSLHRARILAQLQAGEDRHLVLVRYSPPHRPYEEWVYNRADIDAAKVVWAREMDQAHDRELLAYFKDRRAWLLEADAAPPRLTGKRLAQ
jgi:hypothetical protein